MTELGKYLARKTINKAKLARKTGISTTRLRDLTLKENARPMGFELYLVALAIDVDPGDLLKTLYGHLKIIEV